MNIFTFILKLLFNIRTPYVSVNNFINTLYYQLFAYSDILFTFVLRK